MAIINTQFARTSPTYKRVLKKDGAGVPQPINGMFWSLTHKPRYVAGVVSTAPVGIDLEHMRPRAEALFRKVASKEEWALSQGERWHAFYRFWTAKEAVLKAVGKGIGNLSRCRIQRLISDTEIAVTLLDKTWHVEQCCFQGHIAAVVKNAKRVEWVHPG